MMMNVTLTNETTQTAGFHIPFVREMAEITQHMWKNGWDERNGGNVSYLLEEEDVAQYIDINHVIRKIKPAFSMQELAGKYVISKMSWLIRRAIWGCCVSRRMGRSLRCCGVLSRGRAQRVNCLLIL
jgi:hypothetical protein